MNLLKRSPPPPPPPPPQPQPPQQQPHSATSAMEIGQRTSSCSIAGMGGESSAFRAVVANSTTRDTSLDRSERIDRHESKQPERKPSAFRMISQLVGDDSSGLSRSRPSSPVYDQRQASGLGPRPGSAHRIRYDQNEDEDEEIDVQDSDQDVPSSPPVSWRDHWTDQQPLELTKHDR